MTKRISLEQAEQTAHALTKELMDFDEPVSPFSTRFPGVLESCLAQPFATYDNKELYPTLVQKAALHFYLIIKNPFRKRK